MHRFLIGMVQDMHLPETEQNLAIYRAHVITSGDVGYRYFSTLKMSVGTVERV